jgi:hypothetical protein
VIQRHSNLLKLTLESVSLLKIADAKREGRHKELNFEMCFEFKQLEKIMQPMNVSEESKSETRGK